MIEKLEDDRLFFYLAGVLVGVFATKGVQIFGWVAFNGPPRLFIDSVIGILGVLALIAIVVARKRTKGPVEQ